MKKTSPRRADILPRALGAVLLLFLALAVILWFCGVYDISFLPRPDSGNADTSGEDTAPEPPPPPADASPYLAVGISANDLIGCEEALPSAPELLALLASFPVCADPTALDAAATFHGADSRLVRLAIDGLPKTRYTGTKEVRTVVKTVLDDKYRTEFSEEYNTQERQSVMLAGGWTIAAQGDSFSVLDSTGKTLLQNYDPEKFAPTGLSDGQGHILFQNDGAYYALRDGAFQKAEVSEEYLKWSLLCELPLGYGDDGTSTVYVENGLYGYKTPSGETKTEAKYLRAFPHHEGLAIAYERKNVLILDENYETVATIPYETDDVFLTYAEVTVPHTFGEEFYGLNTFDHGLTVFRTRRNLRTYRVFNYTKIYDDSRLYNRYGELISLPQGYELRGYANGMLLLQKSGEDRYGYMDCYGNWVTDPYFSYATPFYQGLAVVGEKDGKKALIDTTGNTVLPMCFSEISVVSRGLICAYEQTCGWVIFAIDGARTN